MKPLKAVLFRLRWEWERVLDPASPQCPLAPRNPNVLKMVT